jgi:hypothetical protein
MRKETDTMRLWRFLHPGEQVAGARQRFSKNYAYV